MANDGRISGLALPQAARLQGHVDALDLDMTEYARLRRPAVRWWWGQGRRAGHVGAICYFCGRLFTSWDMRHPITRQAQDAILAHRRLHAAARPFTLGPDMPAVLAGGEADTEGESA